MRNPYDEIDELPEDIDVFDILRKIEEGRPLTSIRIEEH